MGIKNKSEINTIRNPEFINLTPLDINPLMSKCQIKVLYLGANRNHSYITREAADNMAKTLRGTPIVAAWHEDKKDYGTHGHVMTLEDGKITFSCRTVPYGFVPPDAKVWYQTFDDYDEFNRVTTRTYLMTTGFLWTGQFKELTKVIQEGQPHSMELDEETLEGSRAEVDNSGVEFFIINDATFSKLCILGDDVEPCFEGSAVTPIVNEFSKDSTEFTQTLFTMMNELKDALQVKGGSEMDREVLAVEEEVIETASEPVEFMEEPAAEAEPEAPAAEETLEDVDFSTEEDVIVEDFAKEEDEEEEEKATSDSEDESADEEEEDKKPRPEHSLEEYEALKAEAESLRAEIVALREFKLSIENEKKDALINKYHMLSDEDKAEIIEHKAEFSLAEIEAKLALLYVEKNVDFETLTGMAEEEPIVEQDPITSFSLEEPVTEFAPSFLSALRQTAKN